MRPQTLIALALILAACTGSPSELSVLRYGLTLAPTGIDPHLNASSELTIPLGSVYDTLVFAAAPGGPFVPGLAQRWEISPDARTYTFTLRQDVHFHDGTPFNAQAVRLNLQRVMNPDNHSQKALGMLGPLQSVDVIDEFTVQLTLSEPFAPLLDSLSQVYLGMASPQALERWGTDDYQFHQVGTGPYRFVSYVPNDSLTLEANPDYAWGPQVYESARPHFDVIEFSFYQDPATRALALQGDQVDVIGEIPPQDASRLQAGGSNLVQAIPVPGQPLQYLFNTLREPTADVRVRKALIHSLDRASIVQTVFGPSSPVAQGPLSASTPGGSAWPEAYAFDPELAATLLDQAGWRLQSDGVRRREQQTLDVTMVVPTWGSNPEVAQLVQAAWQALGVNVDLVVVPGFGQLKQAQDDGAYHAIGVNLFGTDPDLLRPFFSSNGIYNWTGYSDPGLDSLLEQASRSTPTDAERLELYARASEQIADQALILPLRDYVNLVAFDSALSGLQFSPQGWNPYLIDIQPGS
jgi:peptide/nickel transport system substrate-binding protein